MRRRLWVACSTLVILLIISVPITGIAAVWTDSNRLGSTAIIVFFTAIVFFFVLAWWTDEVGVPEPNLPRRERRELKDRKRQIRLQKAIREAERKAGLR